MSKLTDGKTGSNKLPSILIVGASRGLGWKMALEFLEKGWHVTGTVRSGAGTELHGLLQKYPGLEIEQLDIDDPGQIRALCKRLEGKTFDMLFVNAGTANRDQQENIAEVSTEEFVRVMLTNALGPMRVIEVLQERVATDGLIGVMSSGQGSIANNEKGGHEVYRGTKAALNQYMRCYAARHAHDNRALVLIAPGWIRTELGGAGAPLSMDEAIPKVVNVLLAQQGRPGLRYLHREGHTVPW